MTVINLGEMEVGNKETKTNKRTKKEVPQILKLKNHHLLVEKKIEVFSSILQIPNSWFVFHFQKKVETGILQ
jgi:hypothetical protein